LRAADGMLSLQTLMFPFAYYIEKFPIVIAKQSAVEKKEKKDVRKKSIQGFVRRCNLEKERKILLCIVYFTLK
jgi:hypothetical protein